MRSRFGRVESEIYRNVVDIRRAGGRVVSIEVGPTDFAAICRGARVKSDHALLFQPTRADLTPYTIVNNHDPRCG